MERHYEETENVYRQMRAWRHDYHNHIQAMQAYLTLNQLDELDNYLKELNHDLTTVDTVLKTGNVRLDAILNSKLSLAKANEIKVDATAKADENLPFSPVDLCVILGNLMDNAIEACLKQENPEDRFIRVYIGKYKGSFYLSVTNSVGGKMNKIGKSYKTTKEGFHGFGIKRVDALVNKYSGYINRQDEGDVFATEVMLPL